MSPRKAVLRVLYRNRQITLKHLVEATGLEYYETWRELTKLRQEGLVHPSIRYGCPGRVGSPQHYWLHRLKQVASRSEQRRLRKLLRRGVRA